MQFRITAFDGEEHRPFTLPGGKPAAVLVHGFPGTPAELRPLGHVLNRMGWTVHAPLLPGFGADINDLDKHTQSEWVGAVSTAVKTLRPEHHPLLLAGHSMGGALALEVAAHLAPDGLILLAPFYRLNHVLWEMLPVLRVVFPRIRPFSLTKLDFSNPEMRQGILNFMPGTDLDDPQVQQAIRDFAVPVAMFAHIRTAGKQAYKAAPHVRMPVLVIQGKRDELVRPDLTRELIRRIPGSIRYHEVDAEHDLISPAQPAWDHIVATVEQFATLLQQGIFTEHNG